MKKLNKILAAFLLAVTLFSSVSVLAPLVSSAAGSESSVKAEQGRLEQNELHALIKECIKGDKTASEAFQYDFTNGYLDYYQANGYAICINRYTGVLYYVNMTTGQILTSNPTNHGITASATAGNGITVTDAGKKLMSQIELDIYENANPNKQINTLFSISDASLNGQITVQSIKNGLRVNYALGNTDNRYLLPAMLTADRFDELFLKPYARGINKIWSKGVAADTLEVEYGKIGYNYNANEGAFVTDANGKQNYNLDFVVQYINAVIMELTGDDFKLAQDMLAVIGYYSKDKEGRYVLNPDLSNAIHSDAAVMFRRLRESLGETKYDFETMFADEKAAGYVQTVTPLPVVRLALEYTINDDGTLSVSLPANSIIFDESFYTLDYVKVLPYFGAGKRYEGTMNSISYAYDGYLFYPDGSGMVLDFSDFRTETFTVTKNIYGVDSAYSAINQTIDYRGESITMPVYGIVNETKLESGSDATVMNGFLAIMEEGAAMSTLSYATDPSHAYLTAYPTYEPYPKDTMNLSSTLSVSGLDKHTIVADSRYTGSYTTRFVMLTAPEYKDLVEAYYEASYVGMANYYREYLTKNGTLKALSDVKKTLPLYVEAFGAMDILGRFLTFPVTKSIPLTTFDDVATMYKELSAEGVENVNFRLTGFANGGMNATYPVKSRWESACGGLRDLKSLLSLAKAQTGDKNLGLYPEFDFMYLNNSETFDGMSVKNNVACMVDNRYASKRVMTSTLSDFTKIRSLVITADALEDLYAKFNKRYGKAGLESISVSTMGSDLNSNFDKKNSVNREDSKDYVVSLLGKMSESYSIMLDGGNAYTLKYASHILNIATDSSHYRYSSYPIPFVGMILHGYVNYAGTPLNYAGNAQYDALRAIESGAAPYYILAYKEENIKKLKEDENLSKYYGVSYTTWKDTVIETYKYLNTAIGGLQDYQIVDHAVLVAERVLDAEEDLAVFTAQEKLFFTSAKAFIEAEIAEAIEANVATGIGLKVTIDREALATIFFEKTQRSAEGARYDAFVADLDAFCDKIEGNYNGMSKDCNPEAHANTDTPCACQPVLVEIDTCEIDFSSYVTDSQADNKADYKKTTYTVDNGNVVMVTYKKGTETVNFILNYNSYAVTVRLGNEIVPVDSYAYKIH